MRKSEWEDPDYIVDLTKNIVGKHVLEGLRASGVQNTRAMFLLLEKILVPKIAEMTSETLGRIGAYGTHQGIHSRDVGAAAGAKFINLTGFKHILLIGFDQSGASGRQRLEDTAVATIVCIARDIVLQADWQAQSLSVQAEEQEFQQAEHDHLHVGQVG